MSHDIAKIISENGYLLEKSSKTSSKMLDEGSFGKVFTARKKYHQDIVAIRVVKKTNDMKEIQKEIDP